MHRFLLLGASFLFAVSANAQSVGTASSTQEFVTKAAVGDMFEIQSSKLAQQKADAESKKFASKMVTDHTKTSTELKTLVAGGKVKATLPKEMDSAHKSKLDKLKGLSGANFDKEYDDMQRSAHRDAVSLFEQYAKGGENPDLKAFAAKHLPHLQEHLKLAEGLKSSPTTGTAPAR